MTWYAGAEGVEPEDFDTEQEATSHALTLAVNGKRAVIWEIDEEEKA